jgi:hypothetical protein
MAHMLHSAAHISACDVAHFVSIKCTYLVRHGWGSSDGVTTAMARWMSCIEVGKFLVRIIAPLIKNFLWLSSFSLKNMFPRCIFSEKSEWMNHHLILYLYLLNFPHLYKAEPFPCSMR